MCAIILSCILQSLTITTLPDGAVWASSGWALWPLAGTVLSKGVLVSQTAHSMYFTQTQSQRPIALHISGTYLQGRPAKTQPFIKLKIKFVGFGGWLCSLSGICMRFIAVWRVLCNANAFLWTVWEHTCTHGELYRHICPLLGSPMAGIALMQGSAELLVGEKKSYNFTCINSSKFSSLKTALLPDEFCTCETPDLFWLRWPGKTSVALNLSRTLFDFPFRTGEWDRFTNVIGKLPWASGDIWRKLGWITQCFCRQQETYTRFHSHFLEM